MSQRRRYIAWDAEFYDGSFGADMFERFGSAGVALFNAFVCACKRNLVPGQLSYGSREDLLGRVGLEGLRMVNEDGKEWALEEFWTFCGERKVTRRTTRGRLTKVVATKWEHWQKDLATQQEREQKRRSRAIFSGDNPRTDPGHDADENPTETETETETEEQLLGGADAPPVKAKWLDDLPADLPKPVDGEPYAAVLARWIQAQGVEVKWPEGRGDKYTELVRIVCSAVGDDSRDARRCAMRLAFEYLERVDVAVSESMRGHLARLVADLGPGTAFRHLVTAVRQGAGLGDYADRERAITAYMAGIQRGERQRAQEARS